jgi:hypothetical protein
MERDGRRSWRELGSRARAWRVIHATWSLAQLAGLGLIWHRVATRRRDPAMWASVSFLILEGGALVVGRGDGPMGKLQEDWGDPVRSSWSSRPGRRRRPCRLAVVGPPRSPASSCVTRDRPALRGRR